MPKFSLWFNLKHFFYLSTNLLPQKLAILSFKLSKNYAKTIKKMRKLYQKKPLTTPNNVLEL